MSRDSYKSTFVARETAADLEKLLSIAEDLHEKCEVRNRMIERYRTLEVTFIIVFVGFLAWSFTRGYLLPSSGSSLRDLVLVGAMMAVSYLVVIEYALRRLTKRMMPDQNALAELVGIMRETESAIAEAEHWSTLERAQFRIRLSRFGV